MNDDDARNLIRSVIGEVAPEADLDSVGPDEMLQEALDLDSIDFLNFVTGLHERTGLEIPEREYPELATLEGCVRYLTASLR
ncbi:MAG TPA: phosphopantetheine-binding protein [Acidimicrobiales bacterium]|nr:phosphopantetheine-binding protein [Acidimicrobiales bacterium]